MQIDPSTGEETTLPVVASPKNLWFQGLDRRSNIDVWWSPDGTALAYTWDGDGWSENLDGDLWVLNVASGESELIVPSCECRELAWSPDGSAIVMVRGPNLEIIEPDGSGRTTIKVLADNTWYHDPAWTPDAERILFAAGDRREQLYVIDRDGSNLTLLGEMRINARDVGNPVAWSPDASRIAYFTWDFGGLRGWTIGIVVANFDGSNPRVVVEDAGECCDNGVCWYPYLAWSPDGTQLAVVIDGPGLQPQGLYVMNADGKDLRLIREDVMARPSWRSAS